MLLSYARFFRLLYKYTRKKVRIPIYSLIQHKKYIKISKLYIKQAQENIVDIISLGRELKGTGP